MSSIADSSAVSEFSRMFPQHQAAITLLNDTLQNPKVTKINWLDLGCGKGQIISQLDENLSLEAQQKIVYHGYDINVDYTRTVNKKADKLNFADYKVHIGDLSLFDSVIPKQLKFDFITCTNVTHEIHPKKFFEIVFQLLKRLNDDGQLFIYDMESLKTPELGAIPLKAADIKMLFETILCTAGSNLKLSPSTWSHRTCKGWSMSINREYIGVNNNIFEINADIILEALKNAVINMLTEKQNECIRVLDTFTTCGTETPDEEEQKISALYEFWALYKALEDLS